MPVYVTRDASPGAPTLSGTVGSLLSVLNAALIIRAVVGYDGTDWYDDTEAALTPTTNPFPLFRGSSTDSARYFGHCAENPNSDGTAWRPAFDRLSFFLSEAGVGGAYAWEYWNGTEWAPLPVDDGTSGFTQDGTVTWSPPPDWAPATVYGIATYWVRVRPTEAPASWPVCQHVTTLGWTRPFTGSANVAVYRQGPKPARLSYHLRVNDGLADASEARVRGYETMSDPDTGTNPFPSDDWYPNYAIWRKSATADSTPRTYYVFADGRSLILFTHTTEYGGDYRLLYYFGDLVSFKTGDTYACFLIGGLVDGQMWGTGREGAMLTSSVEGHIIARSYDGVATSVQCSKHWDFAKVDHCGNVIMGSTDAPLLWPNPVDNRVWLSPVWVTEQDADFSWRLLRGYMRGLWAPCHNVPPADFGKLVWGVGQLANRRFLLVGPLVWDGNGCAVVELDKWDSD